VQNRSDFREFPNQRRFPDPERAGEQCPMFKYPEWLIMVIAILSVKLKLKSYLRIHRTAMESWNFIAKDLDLEFISERQLRDYLKKSVITQKAGKV
jgi:hypothetical protein